ncbi:D-alanyl-D-alanine carboxypeptidase/D-alanyl-D-alanine-endopeptidase [bacterium]|nr:MAG: D-alanyl-D-alanine carboxypeptidase/D-alanyl-D-alanine-endopeptidase [bacterium]
MLAVPVGFVLRHAGGPHAVKVVPVAPAVALAPYVRLEPHGPRWSPAALARAHAAIAALANADGMPAKSGIVVMSPRGQVLYERNAAKLLVPASTMKLLVGSAAFFGLGGAYRLHTRLLAAAPPDAAGVVHGDVVLAGSGDPLLSSADLEAAVSTLKKAGVRRVDGALVVDATAFSGPEQNRTWLPSDLEYDYAAGASAVALDQGVVQIDVTPTSPGAPARIALEPANDAVHTTGTALTTAGTMSLSIERAADGRGLVFSGGIPAGPRQRFWRTVVGEPAFVGDAFARMLRAGGIQVGGVRVAAHPAQAQAVLWDHPSQSIEALVRGMFFDSNNHTAEQLLRVIGRDVPAGANLEPGSLLAGAARERRLFADAGVELGATHVADGSGLSPQDRITASALARVLALDLSSRGGPQFLEELPRAGIEGTVHVRSLDEASGLVRAKDGYEDGASSLAGYVQTRHHGVVAFAFIADDWDSLDRVWQLEDEILDRVSML